MRHLNIISPLEDGIYPIFINERTEYFYAAFIDGVGGPLRKPLRLRYIPKEWKKTRVVVISKLNRAGQSAQNRNVYFELFRQFGQEKALVRLPKRFEGSS